MLELALITLRVFSHTCTGAPSAQPLRLGRGLALFTLLLGDKLRREDVGVLQQSVHCSIDPKVLLRKVDARLRDAETIEYVWDL